MRYSLVELFDIELLKLYRLKVLFVELLGAGFVGTKLVHSVHPK
jgi:hypothetical protein